MAELNDKILKYSVLKAFMAVYNSGRNDITDAIEAKVDVLIGSDSNKSARAIAAEEIAAQLVPENAKESLDTLKEIADWIQKHPDDVAAMVSRISLLETGLTGFITPKNGDTPASIQNVKSYIDTEVGKKVDAEVNKSLMSADEHSKLENIEAGAQVNIIETVKVDDVALTVTGKTVNIAVKDRFDAKVDKETGKSLLADTEIARLAAMSDSANKTDVSAETFTAGTKIGSVSVDGTATDLYAPTVAISAALTSGTEVGTVTINGTATNLYVAPAEYVTATEAEDLAYEILGTTRPQA